MKEEINSSLLIIKQLCADDVLFFEELIALFDEVFEIKAQEKATTVYLQQLLEKANLIVICASYKDKMVGGLTAYRLQKYDGNTEEILLYDIAVKTKYQRNGIGNTLLESLKAYCKNNGIKNFFVPANEEDQHALDFYRANGGQAEKVVHFNYEIKEK